MADQEGPEGEVVIDGHQHSLKPPTRVHIGTHVVQPEVYLHSEQQRHVLEGDGVGRRQLAQRLFWLACFSPRSVLPLLTQARQEQHIMHTC